MEANMAPRAERAPTLEERIIALEGLASFQQVYIHHLEERLDLHGKMLMRIVGPFPEPAPPQLENTKPSMPMGTSGGYAPQMR